MDKNEAQAKADELAAKIIELCGHYGAVIVTDSEGLVAVCVQYWASFFGQCNFGYRYRLTAGKITT